MEAMKGTLSCMITRGFFLLTILIYWPGSEAETTPPQEEYTPPELWNKQEIPNPQRDVWKCGRGGKPSFVCDPNHILSESEADHLDELILDIKRRTPGCRCDQDLYYCPSDPYYGGYHIAVAVLQDILVYELADPNERMEVAAEYAEYLRAYSWSYGRCDDDLVIVVAKKDKTFYAKTGHSVRQVLTDSCAEDIFKENSYYFSGGLYGSGLAEILTEYRDVFDGDRKCSKGLRTGHIVAIALACSTVFILSLVIILYCCGCCENCASSGGGRSRSGGQSWGPSHSYCDGGGGGWGGGGGDAGGGGGTWD